MLDLQALLLGVKLSAQTLILPAFAQKFEQLRDDEAQRNLKR